MLEKMKTGQNSLRNSLRVGPPRGGGGGGIGPVVFDDQM